MTTFTEINKPSNLRSPFLNSVDSLVDSISDFIDEYTTGQIYNPIDGITPPGYTVDDGLLWSETYFPWLPTSYPWLRPGRSTVTYTPVTRP